MLNTLQLQLSKSHLRTYVVLGFGVVAIGFSGIFVRWANAPGAVTGFYRMAVAVIALTPLFLRQVRTHGRLPRREILIALAAGLFFAGDLIFWNTGIMISGATTPTLVANTSPLWVGLGAMLFFHEKLGRLFWGGLLVAMTGAAIVLGVDAMNDVGLGSFFGLLAGVFYSGYFLITQRSRQRLNALTSFWLAGVSATLLLLVASPLLGQPLTGYPLLTYLNFLALGLVVQVMGQLAISYALGFLPASIVSPTLLIQPVVTAILATYLLDEKLTILHLMGGAAVLGGIYIVHYSRAQKKARKA